MNNFDLAYYENIVNSFYDSEEFKEEKPKKKSGVKIISIAELIEPMTEDEEHKMILQKIYALILILLSLFSILVLQGDATVAAFLIPFALYLIFTKQYWLNF